MGGNDITFLVNPTNGTGQYDSALMQQQNFLSSTPLPQYNMVTGFKAFGQPNSITIPAGISTGYAGPFEVDILTTIYFRSDVDVFDALVDPPGGLPLRIHFTLTSSNPAIQYGNWSFRAPGRIFEATTFTGAAIPASGEVDYTYTSPTPIPSQYCCATSSIRIFAKVYNLMAGDTLSFEIPPNSLDVAGVSTPEPATGFCSAVALLAVFAARRARNRRVNHGL